MYWMVRLFCEIFVDPSNDATNRVKTTMHQSVNTVNDRVSSTEAHRNAAYISPRQPAGESVEKVSSVVRSAVSVPADDTTGKPRAANAELLSDFSFDSVVETTYTTPDNLPLTTNVGQEGSGVDEYNVQESEGLKINYSNTEMLYMKLGPEPLLL